jgi:hypothetical protein
MGFTSVRFTDVSQQHYVDVSMQMDDPDSTLTKINPNVLMEDRKVLDRCYASLSVVRLGQG